jgi:hypothetical protein
VITHFCVRGIRKPQGAGFGDSPEDEDGVSVIRSHGSNPALRETMNAIWAEDNGVAVVGELFEQVRQLAEDDVGVAAVDASQVYKLTSRRHDRAGFGSGHDG